MGGSGGLVNLKGDVPSQSGSLVSGRIGKAKIAGPEEKHGLRGKGGRNSAKLKKLGEEQSPHTHNQRRNRIRMHLWKSLRKKRKVNPTSKNYRSAAGRA